jgi:hypothetical protein
MLKDIERENYLNKAREIEKRKFNEQFAMTPNGE